MAGCRHPTSCDRDTADHQRGSSHSGPAHWVQLRKPHTSQSVGDRNRWSPRWVFRCRGARTSGKTDLDAAALILVSLAGRRRSVPRHRPPMPARVATERAHEVTRCRVPSDPMSAVGFARCVPISKFGTCGVLEVRGYLRVARSLWRPWTVRAMHRCPQGGTRILRKHHVHQMRRPATCGYEVPVGGWRHPTLVKSFSSEHDQTCTSR